MKTKFQTRIGTFEYRVLCHKCNHCGGWTTSKSGAIRMATNAGFRLNPDTNEFVCHRCIPVHEDESLEGEMKRMMDGAKIIKPKRKKRKKT